MRVYENTPVLPAVAARVLQVSPKGLRWLGDTGKIRFEKTGGEPAIRLYLWGDVVRLLESRGRARALRMHVLPARASKMATARLRGQLALPLDRTKAKSELPTSAAKAIENRRKAG